MKDGGRGSVVCISTLRVVTTFDLGFLAVSHVLARQLAEQPSPHFRTPTRDEQYSYACTLRYMRYLQTLYYHHGRDAQSTRFATVCLLATSSESPAENCLFDRS